MGMKDDVGGHGAGNGDDDAYGDDDAPNGHYDANDNNNGHSTSIVSYYNAG